MEWLFDPFAKTYKPQQKTETKTIYYDSDLQRYIIKLSYMPVSGYTLTVKDLSTNNFMTEVSINVDPLPGQFRVDYENINDINYTGTGIIEFNSNDANKQVEVTYYAVGEYVKREAGNDFATYSRLTVTTSPPVSPSHGELHYNNTTNKLYKYNKILNVWFELDWRNIITASPEYKANRLRVNSITGKLEISPDGTNWYECIPAVGSAAVELTTLDNTNFTYKYWIAPGQTAIIKNANHIPIVYAKDIEPFFDVAYWHSYPFEYWIGIRPSNILISDGDGQYLAGHDTSISSNRATNLSIVPIIEQANTNENWANFVLRIRNNQRFLNNAIGLGSMTYVLVVTYCSGTAANLSYWLGTWYTLDGSNFQVNVLTLTRRA